VELQVQVVAQEQQVLRVQRELQVLHKLAEQAVVLVQTVLQVLQAYQAKVH
jgi:hypothetical protein